MSRTLSLRLRLIAVAVTLLADDLTAMNDCQRDAWNLALLHLCGNHIIDVIAPHDADGGEADGYNENDGLHC